MQLFGLTLALLAAVAVALRSAAPRAQTSTAAENATAAPSTSTAGENATNLSAVVKKATQLSSHQTSTATENGTVSPNTSAAAENATNLSAVVKKATKLHSKLETIVKGLEVEQVALEKGHAKMAPELKGFVQELKATLEATASMTNVTSAPTALKMLMHALGGMTNLSKALTNRQAVLFKEEGEDQGSMLLGVLMGLKDEPMTKQLDVLRNTDFAKLEVSKALLAKHDKTIPLFQQVASYLDKHGGKLNMTDSKSKAEHFNATLVYFEKRVDSIQKDVAKLEESHKMRTKEVQASIKKSHTATKLRLEKLGKRADRQYRKRSAMYQHELKMMEDVVSSLKSGDVKALGKAQDALNIALRAMQSQTGNFLHLLQLGSSLDRQRDCPYCVAQCIDKCHSGGGAYAECLGTCADAGK